MHQGFHLLLDALKLVEPELQCFAQGALVGVKDLVMQLRDAFRQARVEDVDLLLGELQDHGSPL
ncbi:hypothetical protein BHS07_08210 [Myxococcus xanthus]|nr:hypothetical protein BHS07_08210 [Myxococcus xanthus]QDF03204.1 hypothetical protein BHS04_08230 [Myxococcus xanthus]